MLINNAIVHLIQKERRGQPQLHLRESLLSIDNNLSGLVVSLRKLYNEKTGRGYGSFHDDQVSYPFSSLLGDFKEGRRDFIDFTQTAMRLLESKIQSEPLSTGGFLLFVDFLDQGTDQLIVASIKHRDGLAFDGNLNLTGSMHIDLERLHEMARIDVTGWKSNAERYLSFAKKRAGSDDFSEYFRTFIGCLELANSTQMNKLVIGAIKDFGTSLDMDNDAQKHLRGIAFSYFEEKRVAQEQVSLTMLSQRLSEDQPEAFLKFVNECPEKYPISDGFDPVKSVYKALKTFRMVDKSLKIQFDQDEFGRRVILNEDGDLLIKGLKSDFKQELEEFQNNG